jgi:hypothetical protein
MQIAWLDIHLQPAVQASAVANLHNGTTCFPEHTTYDFMEPPVAQLLKNLLKFITMFTGVFQTL